MNKTIDLSILTDEQKAELFKQVELEKEKVEKERLDRITEYKSLVNSSVKEKFKLLLALARSIQNIKKEVFEDFSTIVEMKEELFKVKENQKSHTFTSEDGKFSITIGNRQVDNFDDTVHAGIEKVKNYIKRITGGQRQELEDLINLLLKKDKNGNLKANRVLELEQIAKRINDIELSEGVNIIKESYKPVKSSTFIEASYKDENGIKRSVPLSVTGVDANSWEDLENELSDNTEVSN